MKGNRIKKLREEKQLKQEELAKILSISPSAIGMYERDAREPNDELTLKLAEYFDVSTDYLLGKSDIRNPEIEIDKDKINIGLSTKDYNPPTKEQQEKIEEFAKFVLKDNLKKKEVKYYVIRNYHYYIFIFSNLWLFY